MVIEEFSDREQASEAIARHIQSALQNHLETKPEATFIASGGTSPLQCFKLLSQSELPWERVKVTLSDERSVPVTNENSNEGMLRRTLLTNRAAAAEFVPLEKHALELLAKPFACALVGVGEDGHFASIFPDNVNLPTALALDNTELCFPVTTGASPLPRISMSLALLLQSEVIYLLAFGESKRAIIKSPDDYPVAALLLQQRTPVHVIWAP